jgi:hypothetical protein
MLKAIAVFELRAQLKRPLLWLVFGLFFLMAFTAMVSDSVRIGGGIGNVHRNAPLVIMQFHLVLSIVALVISTMFVAGAILRDFDLGTYEMFFSRPVRKVDYLLGRFLAAFTVSIIAFLGVPIGMIGGSFAPWLDPLRLGPFMRGVPVRPARAGAAQPAAVRGDVLHGRQPVTQHALHVPRRRGFLRRLRGIADLDPGHRDAADRRAARPVRRLRHRSGDQILDGGGEQLGAAAAVRRPAPRPPDLLAVAWRCSSWRCCASASPSRHDEARHGALAPGHGTGCQTRRYLQAAGFLPPRAASPSGR